MKQMPQISEKTGISLDYVNEFSVVGFIELSMLDDAVKHVRSHPIKKYEERYPPDKYENVITEHNKERIRQLDAVVDRLNVLFFAERPSC
jgi:hypothetical protein